MYLFPLIAPRTAHDISTHSTHQKRSRRPFPKISTGTAQVVYNGLIYYMINLLCSANIREQLAGH